MGRVLLIFLMFNTAYAGPIERIYSYLNGSFTSANQSIYNSNFYNVTVRHCPVEISGGNPNSKYLLLRQAISLFQESPYRVRLVELVIENDIIKSKNYSPIIEIDLEKTCLDGEIPTFNRRDFDSIPKCELQFFQDSDKFVGTTGSPGCSSNLNGASYVSSDVEITKTYFKSLDRGWDSRGNQVWGSKDGPYIFEKTSFSKIYPNLTELLSMLSGESSNQEQFSSQDDDFLYVRTKTCPIKITSFNSINLITNQVIHMGNSAITRASLYIFKPKDPNSTYSDPVIEVYPIADQKLYNYCDQPKKWNLEYNIPLDSKPCVVTFSKGITLGQPTYFGKTPTEGCPSNFRGSSRLDIDEEITFKKAEVWEKWFDSNGNQVAGSKTGPYIYQKEKRYEEVYKPTK